MMWLDKDDLENIAAEYRTAEAALMRKVFLATGDKSIERAHAGAANDRVARFVAETVSYLMGCPATVRLFQNHCSKTTVVPNLLFQNQLTITGPLKAKRQNKLIEECLSLEDVLDGCDHHKAKASRTHLQNTSYPCCLSG